MNDIEKLTYLMALRTYQESVAVLPPDTPVPTLETVGDFCNTLSMALQKRQQRQIRERQEARAWAAGLASGMKARND